MYGYECALVSAYDGQAQLCSEQPVTLSSLLPYRASNRTGEANAQLRLYHRNSTITITITITITTTTTTTADDNE
jgi:hypothetical protein